MNDKTADNTKHYNGSRRIKVQVTSGEQKGCGGGSGCWHETTGGNVQLEAKMPCLQLIIKVTVTPCAEVVTAVTSLK